MQSLLRSAGNHYLLSCCGSLGEGEPFPFGAPGGGGKDFCGCNIRAAFRGVMYKKLWRAGGSKPVCPKIYRR